MRFWSSVTLAPSLVLSSSRYTSACIVRPALRFALGGTQRGSRSRQARSLHPPSQAGAGCSQGSGSDDASISPARD